MSVLKKKKVAPIDITPLLVKEPMPEILRHPTIPKPLHGVAPREIWGTNWWRSVRDQVVAAQDGRCAACGVHYTESPWKQWLEVHECYNIDYERGLLTLDKVVGLCKRCHNFIHSGRLVALVSKKEMDKTTALNVMFHGLSVLESNGLEPGRSTIEAMNLFGIDHVFSVEKTPKHMQDWGGWRLELGGKEYFSKFNSLQEWYDNYNGDGAFEKLAAGGADADICFV